MIPIQDIAERHFLLLRAELSAAKSFRLLQSDHPPERVIIRREEEGAVYFYLLSTAELISIVRVAPKHSPLSEILRLSKGGATDAVDAYDDGEHAPDRCVVVHEGRVLGFCDSTLSAPVNVKRTGSMPEPYLEIKLGDAPAIPVEVPISRSLVAKFPESIAVGEIRSLIVSIEAISPLMRGRAGLPVTAASGTTIDIIVDCQKGIEIEGRDEGRLIVPAADESPALQFELRATEVGPAKVRILCFQAGQSLGSVILIPTVIQSGASGGRQTQRSSLAPTSFEQPDLTMIVFERSIANVITIEFQITAKEPTLGLQFKRFGPITITSKPDDYFRDFFKDIEGLPLDTLQRRKDALTKLEKRGLKLFSDLIPDDLQEELWRNRSRIGSVQILSDEPWVPWELLRLQGDENDRTVEGDFFCEAFALTRWFPGVGRRPTVRLGEIALIVPKTSGLPKAAAERDFMLGLHRPGRIVTKIDCEYAAVVQALGIGKYDGWHYTGHAEFNSLHPGESSIALDDGKLSPNDLSGDTTNFRLAKPLVFWNGCQTGNQNFSLTGIGGWAQSFINPVPKDSLRGAAAFIGTQWSVFDDSALEFAKSFYGAFLSGTPFGEAVRKARLAIKSRDDLTWLAYTVFADPTARLEPATSAGGS